MKLLKRTFVCATICLGLQLGNVYAVEGTVSERKLVPFPIQELQIDLSQNKEQEQKNTNAKNEENAAEQQMIHNANREALLQNWNRQVFMENFGFVGKYEHKTSNRAVVLFYRTDKKGISITDIMKDYAKKFNVDPAMIRMKSEDLYSMLIETKADQSDKDSKSSKMMLYVYKEKNQDPYTVIYVLGDKTQLDDVTNVVEDFFLLISNPIVEEVHVNEDGSLTPVDHSKDGNNIEKNKSEKNSEAK